MRYNAYVKDSAKRAASRKRSSRTRVITEFPPELLTETDAAAANLNMNRSDFIRSAVQQATERLKRARFEAELAEGYRKNGELDRQLCHDFRHVDAEELDA